MSTATVTITLGVDASRALEALRECARSLARAFREIAKALRAVWGARPAVARAAERGYQRAQARSVRNQQAGPRRRGHGRQTR